MLASLVATCKLNGVNPFAYVQQTLRAILEGHPSTRIEQLMPWTCDQASSLAAQGSGVAFTISHPMPRSYLEVYKSTIDRLRVSHQCLPPLE